MSVMLLLLSLCGTALAVHRELLSFGTSYCYVNPDGSLNKELGLGCTPEPVPGSVPACAIGSLGQCVLEGNSKGVDAQRWTAQYDFAFCPQTIIYVRGERCGEPGASCNCGDSGVTCTSYCEQLESVGDWSDRRRESATNRAESKSRPWYGCWSGYETRNGRCHDQTRYLGEECWDDTGECFNDGVDAYDGRHMSCATSESAGIGDPPTCIPSAFKLDERNQCTCNWFDWWIGVACGANQCNGHPCVWSTGDGNYYCDYQQDNDW